MLWPSRTQSPPKNQITMVKVSGKHIWWHQICLPDTLTIVIWLLGGDCVRLGQSIEKRSSWELWGWFALLKTTLCKKGGTLPGFLRPAGGGGGCLNTSPLRFSADSKKTAAVLTYLIPHLFATFVKVSILGLARSGHQVRSSDHTYLTKKLQSRPSYSVWGKVMKLSEYDKVIGTYKIYISDFWYRWP